MAATTLNALAQSPYAFTPLSGFLYLLKTFFYLGIFAVIFYAIMKYVFPKMGMVNKNSGAIQVLDRRMLEMNVSVNLLKVGSKYFLLGTSSKNVFLITELSEKDVASDIPVQANTNIPGVSFAEILAKLKAVLPAKKEDEKKA